MKTFKWMCQENFFQKNAKIWWITGFFYYNDSEVILRKSWCCIYVYEIWDTLRDLVPFVQFRKLEKHPWRSVSFSTAIFVLPLDKKNKIIVFWQKLCPLKLLNPFAISKCGNLFHPGPIVPFGPWRNKQKAIR